MLVFFVLGVMMTGVLGMLSLWMITALLAAGIALWALTYRLTRSLAVHFPDLHTLGDLTRSIFENNTAILAATRRMWSAPQIWEVLQSLMVKQLGIDPQQITPEARFVDDLGMD